MEFDLQGKKTLEDILKFVRVMHPYKVYGDFDTYSKYNEGWSDAIDTLESYLIRDDSDSGTEESKPKKLSEEFLGIANKYGLWKGSDFESKIYSHLSGDNIRAGDIVVLNSGFDIAVIIPKMDIGIHPIGRYSEDTDVLPSMYSNFTDAGWRRIGHIDATFMEALLRKWEKLTLGVSAKDIILNALRNFGGDNMAVEE